MNYSRSFPRKRESERIIVGVAIWSMIWTLQLDHRPLAFGRFFARHFHQRLAVQNHFAVDSTNAGQPGARLFRNELPHRDGDKHRVANLHRRAEIERLRDIDRTWSRKARTEHRGNQAGGIEPMRDALAERRARREMFGKMDRVAIAGKL